VTLFQVFLTYLQYLRTLKKLQWNINVHDELGKMCKENVED